MYKYLIPVLLFNCLAATSCGSDDEPQVPDNALALNMMVGDSDTKIGGSDVYINSSNNFTSRLCGIADFGRKGGLGKNPDLSQLAREVAVTPGNYYQIFNSRDVETVAGARAYPIDASYYNVYVDSWIYDGDKDIAGAKISYTECYPQIKGLPEWGTETDVILKNDNNGVETAVYAFPKDCVVDSDYSIIHYGPTYMDYLDVEVKGNTVSFSNPSYSPNAEAKVTLKVRCQSTFTKVSLTVHSSF